MSILFRSRNLGPPMVLAAALVAGLGGCAQRTCANYSVLDALDSYDRDDDLTHVGLIRRSAVTVPGPAGNQLQCSIWEQRHLPGTTGVILRPQYYSVRMVNNGWVLSK
ncbi:MAG: hypothetical protein INR65_05070 [Gluconacetobacter diazotrophicus]|nr:hypothetical protein [Gluconacetobacter diazotrophicus]